MDRIASGSLKLFFPLFAPPINLKPQVERTAEQPRDEVIHFSSYLTKFKGFSEVIFFFELGHDTDEPLSFYKRG